MKNNRVNLILPYKSYMIKEANKEKLEITNLRMSKNLTTKKFNIRLFNKKEELIEKEFDKITFQIKSTPKNLIILIQSKKDQIEIISKKIISDKELKKYINVLIH